LRELRTDKVLVDVELDVLEKRKNDVNLEEEV
jgi:hypothetical protein